jgi:hypothetical protein
VRAFEQERIELAPSVVEIERPRERFPFSYLPANVEPLLREALECHSAGCYNGFAMLARRAVETALASLGPAARQRWGEKLQEIVEIAELDAATARTLEAVLFGQGPTPLIGASEAAVLIETVKDLFHQAYVRSAKLRAAMAMRRFFAGEQSKITPLERHRRETA